jgi:PAS domain S-box-containing protein
MNGLNLENKKDINQPQRVLFFSLSASLVSRLASLIVFIIGSVALVGWVFDISILKSISPHWTSMRVITAICFLLSAVSLECLHGKTLVQWKIILSRAFGIVVIIAGILTLVSYMFEVQTGQEWSLAGSVFLNLFLAEATRMAVITAIIFSVFGCILLLLGTGSRRAAGASHILLIPMTIMTYLVIVGYIFNIKAFYEWLRLGVALNTGIAFFALCIASFSARTDTWLMHVFRKKYAGGLMARKLLPGLVILPLLIGWLRLHGERSGLFSSDLGVALVAVAYTICFVALTWLSAGSVNRIDRSRRRTEEALAESEGKFRYITTNTPDHIFIQDKDLRYMLVVNPQLGFTENDMIRKTDSEILSKEDAIKLTEIKRRVIDSGNTEYVSAPLISINGKIQYFEGSYVAKKDHAGDIDGIIGYFKNVTEQKEMEEALKKSEERYRSLFNSMTEGFALHEIICNEKNEPVDYRFIDINPAFERLTGLKREGVIGKTHNEILPGDDPRWVKEYGSVALTGNPIQFENYSPALKKHYEVFAYSPALLQFAVLFIDITGRKQAEKLISDNESRLKNSQAIAHLGSWELDLVNNNLTWSDETYRIFGLKPQEFGATYEAFLEAVHPDDRAAVNEAYSGSLREGRDNYEIEHRVVRKATGEIRYVQERCEHIRDETGRTIRSIGMVHDITERKGAAEALRESEERYRILVETAPDAILTHWDNKFLYANSAALKLYNAKNFEELSAHNVLDLVKQEERDLTKERFRKTTSGNKPELRETTILRLDGEPVTVEVLASTVEYKGSTAIQAIIRDITDRVQIETRAKTLASIVESSNDAIIGKNLDGVIQSWNKGAEEMYGYTAEEVKGKPVSILVPPGHYDEVPGILKKISHGEDTEHYETVRLTKDGRLINVLLTVSPIKDSYDNIIGASTIARDITELKKTENELKRSNENLEQFAYVASHDLQEPLRIMASYSELLERRYKDRLDKDGHEFINYIVDSAKHMQKLINDLLAYSRIGRFDKPEEEIDCNSILRRVLDSMRLMIEQNKAVITNDNLPTLMGNGNNFIQLFQNLIGNAIKFHGPETPLIHISVVEKDGELLFSVKDNGIGIEPQYKDRIFVIFQRLHGREQYQGTGIGLSICKKIVETQGGKIWVESEPDKGSTFYFTIPAKGGFKNG